MLDKNDALKLTLIFPDRQYVKFMGEVTSAAIFTDMGREIDPDGLYSQKIFGTVGSDERMVTFGYINLHAEMIHPRIYDYLITLSSKYEEILNGTAFVVYNKTTNTFEPSIPGVGSTGYDFFLKHLNTLDLGDSKSPDRRNMIKVIEKYRSKGKLTNNVLLVVPAGIRDFIVESDERVTEVEINDYYRKILNTANYLAGISEIQYADNIRYTLQVKIQELYKHILNLVGGGKKKFTGKHFTSRNIDYATRNVITGKEIKLDHIDDVPDDIIDYASVGLLQYIKAIDPIAKYYLNEYFIVGSFEDYSDNATLFDIKTKKSRHVTLDPKERGYWTTPDGMNNIFNRFIEADVRDTPALIDGYAIAMVHEDGDDISIYTHDSQYPNGINLDKVRPITYGEMLYVVAYKPSRKHIGVMTRYPITTPTSIVPVMTIVNTTTNAVKKNVSLYGQLPFNETVDHYPVIGGVWDESLSPNYVRLTGHGADMDGDKMSLIVLLEEESLEELRELMNKLVLYLNPDGTTILDIDDKITAVTLKTMTK